MALRDQEASNVDLSTPTSSGNEPSHSSDSSSSPVLNLLSSLSRNTSVISSSSSSSSSSSLVLARPRPLRSFSGQSHGSRSPHNGTRTRSPHSPPSPRTPRPPNYLQRQLGLADPPEVTLPPAVVPDSSGVRIMVPMTAPARPQPGRIANNNVVKRLYSPDDFEFGDVLGEGSYSTVLSVTYRRTGQVFALKVLDKHHLQRVNKVKYAYVEKDSLAKLSTAGHPGIVRLHWAFSDASSLYFVLDKVNNGELMTKINMLGSLSTDCARYYTAQMIDTVCWMHSLGVLHRDMKPENVLLDDNMRIKITDFGTAKILDGSNSDGGTSSFVGSPGYISPELLISYTCGKSADLWAIGCILFQMITGTQPFKALTSYLSMEKTRKAEYAFPDGFDPIARDLVENLLVLEPTARLGDPGRGGVPALRAHPFFASIDWSTLWTSPAPVLEAGLVKHEIRQKQGQGDEDHEGNTTDIGAAWNALVRDLSEDEMGGPDDDDEQATIGDPDERLSQTEGPARLLFPSDDKDDVSLNSTTLPLSSNSGTFLSTQILDPNEYASSESSTEENAGGSGRIGRSTSVKPRHGQSSKSKPNVSSGKPQSKSHPREVVIRNTQHAEGTAANSLSSSAPASYSPLNSIGQDNGTTALIPLVHEAPKGGPIAPEVLPLPGSQFISLVSSGSTDSDVSAKWAPLLQSGEKVIFSSAVRARRRSILPARLKPRVLVLTDQPRLLCLKTVAPSVDGGINEHLKIKSEVCFAPTRLASPASWSATVGPILEAEGGIRSNNARLSAMATATISTSLPTSSSIAERPRTISSSTVITRRGRSVQRRDSNVLRSVEIKGDRSFVVQTDRKRYTYLADDLILASRWVQKIQSATISRSSPNGVP